MAQSTIIPFHWRVYLYLIVIGNECNPVFTFNPSTQAPSLHRTSAHHSLAFNFGTNLSFNVLPREK